MPQFANQLEQQFHQAMLGIYDAAQNLPKPYRAPRFRNMVLEHGGKEAADMLLATPNVSDGFTELFLRDRRLDISVEYLVLQNPWRQLFAPEQLAVARNRLRQYEFDPPPDDAAPAIEPEQAAETDEPTRATTLVHICIGDPQLDHLKQLEKAAQSGQKEFDWWNINKYASPGDMVIFYLKAPISAFVATGVVGRKVANGEVPAEKKGKFFDTNCFWMSNAKLLPRRITLDEAKSHFLAEWPYLNHPVVTSIPNARASSDLVERFLRFLRTPVPPTQEAADLADPPARTATTTYRILRDTELARQIKQMHGHECQICRHTIKLPSGARYAEAHHSQPLGKPHNGPDVMGNILCVCPNHHAELDYGVTAIVLSELRHVDGHAVDPKYAEYHNGQIHKAANKA